MIKSINQNFKYCKHYKYPCKAELLAYIETVVSTLYSAQFRIQDIKIKKFSQYKFFF